MKAECSSAAAGALKKGLDELAPVPAAYHVTIMQLWLHTTPAPQPSQATRTAASWQRAPHPLHPALASREVRALPGAVQSPWHTGPPRQRLCIRPRPRMRCPRAWLSCSLAWLLPLCRRCCSFRTAHVLLLPGRCQRARVWPWQGALPRRRRSHLRGQPQQAVSCRQQVGRSLPRSLGRCKGKERWGPALVVSTACNASSTSAASDISFGMFHTAGGFAMSNIYPI